MKDKLFTIFYMALVAAFFTACVAMVHSATRERVRLNQQLAEQRVILHVLQIQMPENAPLERFSEVYDQRITETDIMIETQARQVPVLEARSADGKLIGYAFQVVGRGFWDMLRGYMAVGPELTTIRGLAFYEQSETPGLGAEITEPWFEQQFRDKQIPDAGAREGALIRLVRPGGEKRPGDADAVTGATETSKRVEDIVNTTLESFLKTMRKRR